MLSTEGFRTFAKDHVLFAHITTMIEGDKYASLLQEKGGNGFPYVVAMDAEGNVLAKLGDRSVDGFAKMMKDAGDYQALRSKKDRTPDEEMRLLGLDFGSGRIKAAEFREKASAVKGLDAAGQKSREAMLVHADVMAEIDKLMAAGRPDPALRIAAGKAYAEMHRAGRIPTEKQDIGPFYEFMLDYAEDAKDAELFATAFGKLKATFGDQKRLEPFWKKLEERLAAIKAAGPAKTDGDKPGDGKKDDGKKDDGKKDEGGK